VDVVVVVSDLFCLARPCSTSCRIYFLIYHKHNSARRTRWKHASRASWPTRSSIMDTPSSNSLSRPRLRLNRHTPIPRVQDSSDMDFTPVAVPSSARSQFNVVDDEDDNQPTPRMPLRNIASFSNNYGPNSEFGLSTSSATPTDTPAARLRALLVRSSDSPNGNSDRVFVPR
jgi:hypothetical protein